MHKNISQLDTLTTIADEDILLIQDNNDSEELKQVTIANLLYSIRQEVESLRYKVGDLYLTTNSTNPSTSLGYGVWQSWGSGQVPVGVDTGQTEFDTVEKQGGEKSHLLTSAESGLVGHNHTQDAHNHTQNPHNHSITDPKHDHSQANHSITDDGSSQTDSADDSTTDEWDTDDASTGITINNQTATNNATTATNIAAAAQNASQAHNNLQPYITCYMWKRIS